MTNKINWGILGPGAIAHKFVQDLVLSDKAVPYAVASRDACKAESFASQYGFRKHYSSYEDLAADPNVDIVYVATPHVFHFENSMLCLRNNKSVLVEKPFGMNSREVEVMIKEAESRKLFLMEAMWTRFIPATEKLLELVNSGIIGKISYIKADFGFKGTTDPDKRVYNKSLGGGSLMDVGIYPAFLALLLLGTPKIVKAAASFAPTGVDSSCAMLFKYSSDALAVLESSVERNTPTSALICGTGGQIEMHPRFHHTEHLNITRGNKTETLHIPFTGNGYLHEIDEVNACLLLGQSQSSKMQLSLSLDLIKTLDRVREKIGLEY
jgi:predicted dehydrogenase